MVQVALLLWIYCFCFGFVDLIAWFCLCGVCVLPFVFGFGLLCFALRLSFVLKTLWWVLMGSLCECYLETDLVRMVLFVVDFVGLTFWVWVWYLFAFAFGFFSFGLLLVSILIVCACGCLFFIC